MVVVLYTYASIKMHSTRVSSHDPIPGVKLYAIKLLYLFNFPTIAQFSSFFFIQLSNSALKFIAYFKILKEKINNFPIE